MSKELIFFCAGSFECLTPVQRNHCENQLKRRPGCGKGRSQRSTGRIRHEEPPTGFCEIHFLPLIVVAQDLKHLQKLHCIGGCLHWVWRELQGNETRKTLSFILSFNKSFYLLI